MAVTIYLGRTEPEWRQLLDALKAEELSIISGDRFVTVSTGGKSYSRRVRSADEVRSHMADALRALSCLNPDTYGRPTERVCLSFGGSREK